MKLLFYTRFAYHPLTYDEYLHNKGCSGTDACLLEQTHHLRQLGHTVVVISGNTAPFHDSANDVSFLSHVPRESLHEYDMFCPLMFLDEVADIIVQNLRPDTPILVYQHSTLNKRQEQFFTRWLTQKRVVKNLVISPFQATHKDPYGRVSTHIIPNGLNGAFATLSDPSLTRLGNVMFSALFERGGLLAAHVFQCLPYQHKAFHVAGSHVPDDVEGLPDTVVHGSLSKSALIEVMNTCDYFLYPLVHASPPHLVHIDTYACCVLEAMACGVVVISWDVGALRHVYGDRIHLLTPPKHEKFDMRAAETCNPYMYTEEAAQMFVEAVQYLDARPVLKEKMREEGRRWALQQTWQKATGAFASLVTADGGVAASAP